MLRKLDRAVELLLGLIAAALIATAFGQVVARYAFGRPLTWVLEFDVVLLVWLTMLAGYIGVRRGLLMAMDFAVAGRADGTRRWMGLAVTALGLAFTAVLFATSFQIVDAFEGIPFASLPVGQAALYWSLPVGSGLLLVALADEFVRRWRR